MIDVLVMDEPDIVCVHCHTPIPEGAFYSQRLVSVGDEGTDAQIVVEVVCDVACAAGYITPKRPAS